MRNTLWVINRRTRREMNEASLSNATMNSRVAYETFQSFFPIKEIYYTGPVRFVVGAQKTERAP